MGWRSNRFTHSQQGSKALQEVSKVVAPTEGQGHEEGASLGAQSVHSNFRRGFFTILDNVLITGESARGEEIAARPHPYPGGLQEGSGGGVQEIARRRTSPRRSDGHTSVAKSVSLLVTGPSKKA
jgi:hypothetical protein